MTSLALSRRLLDRLQELPRQTQDEVHQMSKVFLTDSRSASLDLESYEGALDSRFRTVRLNRGLRGLIWALEGGYFVLDDVATHDQAEIIARRRKCSIHPFTGVLRIVDVELTREEPPESIDPAPTASVLFEEFRDKDLRQLGISPPMIRILRRLASESDLEALAEFAPKREIQAAFMLAAGYTPESAFAELAVLDQQGVGQNISSAIERAGATGNLFLVRDERDLMDALGKPFEAWRIYLHASQRELALKPRFEGPVRVIGGPGTGKTVVALHRARYLAEQSGFLSEGTRILFTTFSTSLAHAIGENLHALGGEELCKSIDVRTADGLASQVAFRLTGIRPPIISEQEILEIIGDASGVATDLTPMQVLREWEDVILAGDIRSKEAYLHLLRRGSGRQLRQAIRERVWELVEHITTKLHIEGKETFLQRAQRAANALSTEKALYEHAIVDEAQDLHAAHWRLIRAAVAHGPNDLFIVGDAHQRIYRHRSPLSLAGIDCHGRNRRLCLNYRTSAGIIEWAKKLISNSAVDDLDDGTTDLIGYRSVMDGPPPAVTGCENEGVERQVLMKRLEMWLASSIPASAIAVACRTNSECNAVAEWLSERGIRAQVIRKGEFHTVGDTVNVMTMHRIKGLEFRAVAIIGVSKSNLPQEHLLLEAADDSQLVAEIIERERRLLFTACTRPREALSVSWSGEPSPFLDRILEPTADQA